MSLETHVDIIAVGTNPVLYNIECLICDKFITEDTTDGDSLDSLVEEHKKSHNL